MRTDFDLNVFQINADLVLVHMDAGSMPAAITQLANVLIEQGYAKPSYTQAALDRERVSPTGLPTKGVGTAIPHASSEHTLKPGIAVGTLAEPVAFGQLGDPDTLLDVSVVFMLSVTEPEAQVYLLQSLIEMYGDEQMLLKLHAATGPDIIVHEVNAALQRIGAARH
jgi:PTS system galactitol-specific IIA component